MKLLKNISVNLKIIFLNYGFYICAIFTVILCFTASIYYDSTVSENYSIIKSLTEFNCEFMLTDTSFCTYKVIECGSGSWLSMFIPIISAFAFIPFMCDEKESKTIRSSLIRSSRFTFHTSKFIAGCLSGGFAVVFGFAIFALIVSILFPDITQYSSEMQEMMKDEIMMTFPELAECDYGVLITFKFIEIFLYGVISSIPAVVLTSVMNNKYLVLCIPFFLKYALTQTCVKISSQVWSDLENPNKELGRFVNILAPDSIVNLFQSSDKEYILLYNFGIIVIIYLLYLTIQNRRLDCGE